MMKHSKASAHDDAVTSAVSAAPLSDVPSEGTFSEQPGVLSHPRRLLGQVNSDADLDPTKPQPDQQEDDGQRLLCLAGRDPFPAGERTVSIPYIPGKLPRLFDAATAWDALPRDAQRRIGVAGIIAVLGSAEQSDPTVAVGWAAAEYEGHAALQLAVAELLGEGDVLPDVPRPDLSPLGVRSCRVCGCTDACGCPGGCSWVGPSLCSQCAPELVEAAAALPPSLLALIAQDRGVASDDDPDLAAALHAGLVEIYSGQAGQSAWAATADAKLLRDVARAAKEVAAHD